MAFFKLEKDPENKSTLPIDIKRATLLMTVVIKHRKFQRRDLNLKAWINQFRILRESWPPERVKKVFDWYIVHFNEKFVPWAYSARTFRTKFPYIEKSMQRFEEESIKDQMVEVSEDAQKILEIILGKHWPGETREELPRIVQISIDNYLDFMEAHLDLQVAIALGPTFLESSKKETTQLATFHRYLTGKLSTPQQFVLQWMLELNQYITSTTWKGSLTKLIFSPNQKKFKQMGYDWASQFCHDPTRFDLYMRFVGYED